LFLNPEDGSGMFCCHGITSQETELFVTTNVRTLAEKRIRGYNDSRGI
jgi:hypothetical protein